MAWQRLGRSTLPGGCPLTLGRSGNVTEMLLNLLRRISRRIKAGVCLHILRGAKLVGWLGNAWGGHLLFLLMTARLFKPPRRFGEPAQGTSQLLEISLCSCV